MMGLGLGRRLKKWSGVDRIKKDFRRSLMGGPIWGKVLEKQGVGINPETGKWSAESMLDPGGIFGGPGDLFHKKMKGYKEFTPESEGPDQKRIQAEARANQHAAQMLAERRRALRRNSLSTGGAGGGSRLASVLAYGKTQLGQ